MVKKTEYKIYTERECKEEPYRKKVQLFGYVVGKHAPVVLICPGGAYNIVFVISEVILPENRKTLAGCADNLTLCRLYFARKNF